MDNSKQIKIGAALSYISIAVNIISGLIYTPWMIKQIGQSQYGLYTLANSLITLFLIDFGLSSATTRYVAKYRAENDEEKANRFLGCVYKLYLLIDAVIFTVLVVIFFCLDLIYVKLTPAELAQFKIVYLIAAGSSVFNFPFVTLNGILTAYEKIIQLKVADLLYRILVVGLTCTALFLGYNVYALVLVNAIAGLIVILFKYIVIKKTVPVKVDFKNSDKGIYKEIFGFSVWVTVASLAQRLIFNITPTILGIVADSSAIAVFGIVVTIEGYSYTITTAINGIFTAEVARAYTEENFESKITPLLIKVGKFQYAINGLIFAGFVLVGKPFINLWMGSNYADAYYVLMLVIFPGLFYNSLQIAETAMIVAKKVKIQAYIGIIVGVINVILSLILSKLFGVIGAGISICIAYMVRATLFNIVYHKVMHFNIKEFAKKCYIRMSWPMLFTIIIGIVIFNFISVNRWVYLLIACFAIVLVYLMFVWFLGLDKEERKIFYKKIKDRRRV